MYLSNPKPGHTTGGSGRGARRGGRVGSGRVGCQQNFSHRKHKSLVLSKGSKKRRLSVSPEARTNEILCKQMEERNERLTRGLSAVDKLFIRGTRSALCSWLLTSGPTPFCLCKPFSCKACPGSGWPDRGTPRADRLMVQIGACERMLFKYNSRTGHALHEKGFTNTKRRRSTIGHLSTKSASRPAVNPLTNRLSTGDFVPAFGLHRISLVRVFGETFKRFVQDALECTRDACLLDGCSVGVQS